jgi:CHASE2 domain-containing sensor protein
MADASSARRRPTKFPTFSLLACVAAAIGAIALVYQPLRSRLDKIEYWTADWRTSLLADRVADKHPRINLVLFDPATFKGNIVSPIPRDDHAKVLRAIAAMQPAAIGLDFYFIASQGDERDGAMLSALREIDRPIVVGAVDHHTNEFDDEQLAYQQQFLAQVDRPKGYLALDYGPGHVVRRTSPPLPESPFQESFARQIALAAGTQLSGPGTSSASTRVAWLEGPGHDTEPFYRLSAKELLHGTTPARQQEIAQRIAGNIVLTGIAMPNSDRHDTALSVWTDEKMLGVMVHSHILAQLLDGRYYYELEGTARAAVLLAVGLSGLLLSWSLAERRASLFNLGLATAVLVAVDALCYLGFRLVLPFTLILYVWFIGALAGRHLRILAQWARSPAPAALPQTT